MLALRNSLSRQVIVTFVLLIVFILLNAAYSLYQMHTADLQRIEQNVATQHRIAAIQIRNELDKFLYLQQSIADQAPQFSQQIEFDNTLALSIMLNHLAASNHIDLLFLLADDEIIAFTEGLTREISEALQGFLVDNKASGYTLLPNYLLQNIMENLNPAQFSFATVTRVSVPYVTGDLAGTIFAVRIYDGSHGLLQQLKSAGNIELQLQTPTGETLLSTVDNLLPHSDNTVIHTKSGDILQPTVLAIEDSMQRHVASLIIYVDITLMKQQEKKQLLLYSLSLLVVIILSFVVFNLLRTKVFARMLAMLQVMKQVKQGSLDKRIALTGTDDIEESLDEVGFMAHQFNHMLDEVQSSYQKLEQVNHIVASINQVTSFSAMLELLIRETAELAQVTHAISLVRHRNTEQFYIASSIGITFTADHSDYSVTHQQLLSCIYQSKVPSNVIALNSIAGKKDLLGDIPFSLTCQTMLSMQIYVKESVDAYLIYFLDTTIEQSQYLTEFFGSLYNHITAAFIKTRLLQQLKESSYTDQLTGLKNRHYLMEAIQPITYKLRRALHKEYASNSNRVAAGIVILLIDIDHFKTINDNYGHSAGDKVLATTAKILQDNCRQSDLVIRWGGEEFLIVVEDYPLDGVHHYAEKIRNAFADTDFILSENHYIHRTCSIGFASFDPNERIGYPFEWEHLMDLADNCLYVAKRSQRNAWVGVAVDFDLMEMEQSGIEKYIAQLQTNQKLRYKTSITDGSQLIWIDS